MSHQLSAFSERKVGADLRVRPFCSNSCIRVRSARQITPMEKQSTYPPGWGEARVRRVLAHYEAQTEAEAVAEDEASFEDRTQTAMEVPIELVPVVRELIAKHRSKSSGQLPD